MASYPTLQLLERHGDAIAVLVGACPFVASLVALYEDASPWWLVAGAIGSAVLYLAGRSYVEMIRLMTDMLLPK